MAEVIMPYAVLDELQAEESIDQYGMKVVSIRPDPFL